MKKIFLFLTLLATSLLLINCSKDDENVTPLATNLFGTWNLDYYVTNGQLVEDIICKEQVTYSFSSNETYTKTTFAGDGSSNCVVAVIINGTWENLSDNEYQLVPNGSNVNEFLNITFQDNFTKFSIVYNSSYTEVYSKR